MLARADELAKLTVQDEHGRSIELGTLWSEHAVALAFVRHFG